MLAKLTHWLRAAGYDVAMADPGTPDKDLLAEALESNRLLLTRDREFLERGNAEGHVFLIQSDDLDAQVAEITEKLSIDWLKAPFTRCLMDNTPLRPAITAELERLPKNPEDLEPPVTTCPTCGRLYWRGGHTQRMIARLTAWKD